MEEKERAKLEQKRQAEAAKVSKLRLVNIIILVLLSLCHQFRELVKKQLPYLHRTCLEIRLTSLASLTSRVCRLMTHLENQSQTVKGRNFASNGSLKIRNTKITSLRNSNSKTDSINTTPEINMKDFILGIFSMTKNS